MILSEDEEKIAWPNRTSSRVLSWMREGEESLAPLEMSQRKIKIAGRFFPDRPSPKSGLNLKRWNISSASGVFPSAVYRIADSDGAKERELRYSARRIKKVEILIYGDLTIRVEIVMIIRYLQRRLQ